MRFQWKLRKLHEAQIENNDKGEGAMWQLLLFCYARKGIPTGMCKKIITIAP